VPLVRTRSLTFSSHNSSQSSLTEESEYESRSRTISDAISTGMTIDTERYNNTMVRAPSTYSGVSSRMATRKLRSRNSSMDQFDSSETNSPLGPFSALPSPFSSNTSPRGFPSSSSTFDKMEKARMTTLSPSVQLGEDLQNMHIVSEKAPLGTIRPIPVKDSRSIQAASSMYVAASGPKTARFPEEEFNTIPIKRCVSLTEQPVLTQRMLEAAQKIPTAAAASFGQPDDNDDDNDGSSSTDTDIDHVEDFIFDPDIRLPVNPQFKGQDRSPVKAVPKPFSLPNDIGGQNDSSCPSLPPLRPATNSQAASAFSLSNMFTNVRSIFQKTERSPLQSENGSFTRVANTGSANRQSSSTTTTTAAIAMATRQEGQSMGGNALKKAHTLPIFATSHASEPTFQPKSPLLEEKTYSLSQNDAEVYSTPQSIPISKALSGVRYDWAITEEACPKVCTRLLQKFTSSHDDLDAIRSGRATCPSIDMDAFGPGRLNRSKTSSGVNEMTLMAHLSSNQLFQMDHSSSQSLTSGNIPSNNDIISLSSIDNSNLPFGSTYPPSQHSLSRPSFLGRNSDSLSFHTGLRSIAETNHRSTRNLQKSRQKWNRMSMGFRHKKSTLELSMMSNGSASHNEDDIHVDGASSSRTSLSPAVGTKFRTSTNYRLRFTGSKGSNRAQGLLQRSTDDYDSNGDSDDMHSVTDMISNPAFLSPRINHGSSDSILGARRLSSHHNVNDHFNNVTDLNEFNFRANIIGGTYQQSFQDAYPVIAPPASSEVRAVGIHYSITDATLALRMYYPAFKTEKVILFNSSWTWILAKPVGCIIFEEGISPGKKCNGYFVLQHPSDWNDHSPLRRDNSHLFDRLVANHSLSSANASFISTHSSHYYPMTRSGPILGQDDELAMNISLNDHSGIMHAASEHGIDEHNLSSDSLPMVFTSRSDPDAEHGMDDSIATIDLVDAANTSSAPIADWTNISIVYWVMDFLIEYDTPKINQAAKSKRATGKKAAAVNQNAKQTSSEARPWLFVCKTWRLAALRHHASYRSRPENVQFMAHGQWVTCMLNYKWKKFLGEGACKKVYCVQDKRANDFAISLVDIDDMQERDMEDAIIQELAISMICSLLKTMNICPNLVQVYSLFQAANAPPSVLLESSMFRFNHTDRHSTLINQSSDGKYRYQYVRMEFCTGGDLDDLLLKVHMFDIPMVRIFLFQMFFALYSCREQLALRHYDIKLLNFLVTSSRSLLQSKEQDNQPQRISHRNDEIIQLNIGFGQYIYELNLAAHSQKNELVKLTDFGTSMIGAGGLGDPVTVQQFTTLENTPIEFFLLGSDARQAYSADTFCLGLSMLHLVTGHEPYESLLKDVLCPRYLIQLIEKKWERCPQSSPYHVINEVITSLDTSEEENPGIILYHTIYRYLVLFSAVGDILTVSNTIYASSPIWLAIVDALNLPSANLTIKRKNNKKDVQLREESRMTFERDCKQWSVMHGQYAIMKE
jgi:hypothetical protein